MEWMRAASWSGSIVGRSLPLLWSPLGTSSSSSLCLTTRLMALASPSATRSSKRVSRKKRKVIGEYELQQPHSGFQSHNYRFIIRRIRARQGFTVGEHDNHIRRDVSEGEHFLFSLCQSRWESCWRRKDQLITQTCRPSGSLVLALYGLQRHTQIHTKGPLVLSGEVTAISRNFLLFRIVSCV